MSSYTDLLQQAQDFLANAKMPDLTNEVATLEQLSYAADFWQQADAQAKMQQLSTLKTRLQSLQQLDSLAQSLETALFLWTETGAQVADLANPNPTDFTAEQQQLLTELTTVATQLQSALDTQTTQAYLAGPYDHYGALLSLHAGQGGTEAMDWTQMLARMYTRYFERQGWKYRLVHESRGEEAGLKAAHYEITAPLAYGYLKHEAGTHRLVRLSPFNANSLRQTSFSLVEVLPLIDDQDQTITIAPTDLEWSYSRAGGPGGQNVNKVNSAVELYYKPLDLTIRCREERSQEQNRQRALQLLKAQLAQRQEAQQQAELAATKGEFRQASWGNQIRNYVLHPYQLVKDTRTNVETSQTQAVLDGDLDQFITAEIAQLST